MAEREGHRPTPISAERVSCAAYARAPGNGDLRAAGRFPRRDAPAGVLRLDVPLLARDGDTDTLRRARGIARRRATGCCGLRRSERVIRDHSGRLETRPINSPAKTVITRDQMRLYGTRSDRERSE